MKQWSILIPARNEQEHLACSLAALTALRADPVTFEVIVGDNGSTDSTVAVARSFSDRLPMKILSLPDRSVGAVRNALADIASGRYFAFLDADCLPPTNWLAASEAALKRGGPCIIGAPYSLPESASWAAKVWHRRFQAAKTGSVSYVPGGTMLIDGDLFRGVGGFDPSLRSNEDSEFCSRARSAGIAVIAVPEIATVHLGAEKSLAHFARRQMWHGSNVVNGSSFSGNQRAIGLAAYTLSCLMTAIVALLLARADWVLIACSLIVAPPVLLALGSAKSREGRRDLPALLLLLITYAAVRAFVLPLALLRGARYSLRFSGKAA